jgi:hypothetical protein
MTTSAVRTYTGLELAIKMQEATWPQSEIWQPASFTQSIEISTISDVAPFDEQIRLGSNLLGDP